MPIDPIQLARQLIDIPSPTEFEREIGEFLDPLLSSLGFSCERHHVSSERFNILARTAARPRVILCTHIDTVPPFFSSSEDGSHLYGRGACDTKGLMAAMICAAEALLGEGVDGFGLLLVVGEETDSIGAKRANEHFAGLGSEYVVVGEPTESTFVRATKGALTVKVEFSGVAAHSAYPELGDSAIVKLAEAIRAITALDWGESPSLGRTTANVGVVRGGLKANIVPPSAELEMIFRLVEEPEIVLRRLESLVAPFDGHVSRWYGNAPVPMVVPRGAQSTVVAFNTDAPHLGNLGRPLLYGPGSILDAHTDRERIAKGDILAAIETYRALVPDLIDGKVIEHV
ncbi:MAG: M20/M25/M40 family metallo-hydrolase [Thermoanaerobaculia bacterium]|nr:M20/M25/M40 family metallo-hydrolase [Thermoanaerobaculia bacterium]